MRLRLEFTFICAAALLALAGCQSTQVMTAAAGTKLEARQVVALVYLQQPDPAIRQLPFAAGDIAPAVARMRGRWAQLKALLDAGEAGITADGFIVRRERSGERDAAAALLRAENLDRQILYAAAALEVGHGANDQFGDWMPFERAAFAREWVAQAPAGWWVRDERHAWSRTEEKPVAPPATVN